MKKYVLLQFLFLVGCVSNGQYFYSSENTEYIRSGSGITYDKQKQTTQKNSLIQTALLNSGLLPVDLNEYITKTLNQTLTVEEENAIGDLAVFVFIEHHTMPDTINVPIQEKTSINSFDSRFIGNTLHTNVNYNYETVGYQTVYVNRPVTCLYLGIKHYREKIVSQPKLHIVVEDTPYIHWSKVCTFGNLSDNSIIKAAIKIYSQNNILNNAKKLYNCSSNDCYQIQ